MADLLHRLASFCIRRRRTVVAAWLAVLVLLGIGAAAFMGPTTDEVTIPGTESQRALDALAEEFPTGGEAAASGTLLIQAQEGRRLTDPDVQAAVGQVVQRAGALPDVVGTTDPFTTPGAVNPNGTVASIAVQFSQSATDLPDEAVDSYRAMAEQTSPLLRVVPGGELAEGGTEIGISITEVIGVLIAGLVLIVTFGSLVAAGMTLLTALVGVIAGMAGLLLLTSVVEVSAIAPILALMLGLAVGIDYALFITARHRGHLADPDDPADASSEASLASSIARAVGTAGTAVVFAGGTVIVALAGLSVVGVPFLTAMGLAAAATVLVAVLIAITLVPAMLGFVGARVLPKRQRPGADQATTGSSVETTPVSAGSHAADGGTSAKGTVDGNGFGRRWARFVTRHRVPVVLVGVGMLVVLALPTTALRLALPDNGTAAVDSAAREAFDLQAEAFGAGTNGPLVLVVDGPDATAASRLTERVGTAIAALPDVVTVSPGVSNADGTVRLVNVIPASGPSSEETATLVGAIRDTVRPLADAAGGDIAVTGQTAVGVDVSEKLNKALFLYLGVVVGLSFLILLLAFRSVLVPIKATVGFLLTIASTFGVTVAVFQWGWLSSLVGIDTAGPLISFLPIIMVGVLFGLAMDYQLFIVSRVREAHSAGRNPDEAVHEGMGHGARVVTAAALIMTSVFAGFILAHAAVIKTIGFGLALGVLIDAFVVRMTLVPAVLSLLGDRAWWLPRWLDRLVPTVDMEGHGLAGGTSDDEDEQSERKVLVSRT